jgi:hypothetical protein
MKTKFLMIRADADQRDKAKKKLKQIKQKTGQSNIYIILDALNNHKTT